MPMLQRRSPAAGQLVSSGSGTSGLTAYYTAYDMYNFVRQTLQDLQNRVNLAVNSTLAGFEQTLGIADPSGLSTPAVPIVPPNVTDPTTSSPPAVNPSSNSSASSNPPVVNLNGNTTSGPSVINLNANPFAANTPNTTTAAGGSDGPSSAPASAPPAAAAADSSSASGSNGITATDLQNADAAIQRTQQENVAEALSNANANQRAQSGTASTPVQPTPAVATPASANSTPFTVATGSVDLDGFQDVTISRPTGTVSGLDDSQVNIG